MNLEVSRGKRTLAYLLHNFSTVIKFFITVPVTLRIMTDYANNNISSTELTQRLTDANNSAPGFIGLIGWGILIYSTILIFKNHQSLGGKVCGYKWVNATDGTDNINIGSLIGWAFLYIIIAMVTIGIVPLIDVIGLGKRNQTFWEKWSNVKKVNVN